MKYLFLIIISLIHLNTKAQVSCANIKGYKPGMSFSMVNGFNHLAYMDQEIFSGTFHEKDMTFAGYVGVLQINVSKITNNITSVKWESKDKLPKHIAKKISEVFFSKYKIPMIIGWGSDQPDHYNLKSSDKSYNISELYCSAAWHRSSEKLSVSITDYIAIKKDKELWDRKKDDNIKKKAWDDM